MMDLSGSIDIDGSSTVYPVSEGVAEEYSGEYLDELYEENLAALEEVVG